MAFDDTTKNRNRCDAGAHKKKKKTTMANKSEEVTGVSRSGRVRKKSSKLMDFESSEEVETRPKKATPSKSTKAKSSKNLTVPPLHITLPKKLAQTYHDSFSDENSDEFGGVLKEESYMDEFEPNIEIEDDHKIGSHAKTDFREDDEDFEEAEEEEEDEEIMDDLSDMEPSETFGEIGVASSRDHSVMPMQSSLYLTEKSKKKLVLKNGKVVASRQKTQRKDKGKSRLTAYMVWAKEMRPVISNQNPDMDFVAVSKRLGELWANVSKAERVTWKRRALRLANKSSMSKGGMITTGAPAKNLKESPTRSKVNNTSPKRSNQQKSGRSPAASGSTLLPDDFDLTGTETFDASLSLASPPTIPISARAGEMEPLDVASHLHLLGESLSVIGTRLKEHEGQIAVSGSLSVLLDSVVCALGPLLCLTRLLPETNGCPPETLSRILDNIAYIMPGL